MAIGLTVAPPGLSLAMIPIPGLVLRCARSGAPGYSPPALRAFASFHMILHPYEPVGIQSEQIICAAVDEPNAAGQFAHFPFGEVPEVAG